ncbi:TrkH family potassium uptake protein [Lederbergia citrea]
MFKKTMHISPSRLLILVFFSFITLGTLLLKLPIASITTISWIDALFTVTSAVTVTGLNTVDASGTFTTFGQIIIMILIQVGGLGIMSFSVLIFIMLRKKIGLKQRVVMQHALNQISIGGVIKLVRNLFVFSFAIEGIAVIILCLKWVPEYGFGKGIYFSFFHSISAFNNAGFALWPDNLSRYVGSPVVNLVITSLIIIGGIGFTVISDLWSSKKLKYLSLHSKLMIFGTLFVNIVSMLIIFLLEFQNPHTMGGLDTADKWWASYFQAITTRTAGFNTIDIAGLENSTVLYMLLLMFVGAGSASTGGGIKLTTFLIILLAVATFLKGKKEVTYLNRTINHAHIYKALAVTIISLLFIFFALFILNVTEDLPFMQLMYEVVSAFGTVGLSMGITAYLSTVGKGVIIFMMFLGKIGPLTLAFSLAKPDQCKVRYPQEDVLIG